MRKVQGRIPPWRDPVPLGARPLAASASANGYLLALDGVTLRRFSATGAPLGGPLTLDGGEGDELRPAVTFNWRANQYLVTWFRALAGQTQILSQRLTDSGALVGGIVPLTDLKYGPFDPAVAYDGQDNQYLATWGEPVTPTAADFETDLVARRLDATGAPVGGPFPVVDAYASQRTPALTFGFAPNNFLVVWTDSRNDDTGGQNPFRDDVYGRILE